MSETSVVNIHRINGKRPEFDEYCGRMITRRNESTYDLKEFWYENSIWANPFTIEEVGLKNSLKLYEPHIRTMIKLLPKEYDIEKLRGKRLGCWCITTKEIYPIKCHCQVIMKILNENDFGIHLKEINKETIIFYSYIKELCKRKYEGHMNGCPNVEKCKGSPYFGDIINNHSNFYLFYLIFNFKEYKEMRKEQHPKWSEKQVTCLLYYQNSQLKKLKEKIIEIQRYNKNIYVLGSGCVFKLPFQEKVYSMESTGINVFSTLKMNGIKIDVKLNDRIVFCWLICSNEKLRKKQEKRMF